MHFSEHTGSTETQTGGWGKEFRGVEVEYLWELTGALNGGSCYSFITLTANEQNITFSGTAVLVSGVGAGGEAGIWY